MPSTLTRTKTRRRLLGAAVAGCSLTAGAMAFNAFPASAAGTSKIADTGDFMTASQFEFKSNQFRAERRDQLVGRVSMFVNNSGHYWLSGSVTNNLVAWRNVTFTCTTAWGDVNNQVRASTARYQIGGNSSKNFTTGSVYDPRIQRDWAMIRDHGRGDCSMNVG